MHLVTANICLLPKVNLYNTPTKCKIKHITSACVHIFQNHKKTPVGKKQYTYTNKIIKNPVEPAITKGPSPISTVRKQHWKPYQNYLPDIKSDTFIDTAYLCPKFHSHLVRFPSRANNLLDLYITVYQKQEQHFPYPPVMTKLLFNAFTHNALA